MRADGETSLFLGAQSNYTTDPSFYFPKEDTLPALMPCFRLMDDEGLAVPGATLPEIDKETCVRMIETMVSVNEFDKVFNDAQRQGRLSFYFTNRGEEAVAVGTAAALKFTDWIWPQYRELGASFWRGITYEDAANQCCCEPANISSARPSWWCHSPTATAHRPGLPEPALQAVGRAAHSGRAAEPLGAQRRTAAVRPCARAAERPCRCGGAAVPCRCGRAGAVVRPCGRAAVRPGPKFAAARPGRAANHLDPTHGADPVPW